MQIQHFHISAVNETSWLCRLVAPSQSWLPWLRSLQKHPPAWLVDCISGPNEALLVTDDNFDPWQIRHSIEATLLSTDSLSAQTKAHELVISTEHAVDVQSVADATGLEISNIYGLLAQHTFTVTANGFAPGFAYLSKVPNALILPRRKTPRTKVPAGSFAIASEYAAIYPAESPGGWHILGYCAAPMFDLTREQPCLLNIGDTVRFTFTGRHA